MSFLTLFNDEKSFGESNLSFSILNRDLDQKGNMIRIIHATLIFYLVSEFEVSL